MPFEINNGLQDKGLVVAACMATDIRIVPSSLGLKTRIEELVSERNGQEFPPSNVKDAVRGLLKAGGFKPAGRNKPASEYLAQSAREGRFPYINNLVDINNFVSLSIGLPISLLDAESLGDSMLFRYGREGERYIFNTAGQEIELNGLICACSGTSDMPFGNPVKDSVAGKIKESTKSVVGIIYAPSTLKEVAQNGLCVFSELLSNEGGAASIETRLV